jgi:hypothetical protein
VKELSIVCHKAIGPIKLGVSRVEIRKILADLGWGLGSSRKALDFFCEASIQVEYAADETAEFIGISFHSSYICTYDGMNVFNTPAEELFSIMAASEDAGSAHRFDSNGYVFPDQVLTLWEADPQYDRLGGEVRPIWAQVGIGDVRYLAAIARIRRPIG